MTIADNLKRAIALIQALPDEAVCLAMYKNLCGTHFCTAGHLANDPFFKEMGFEWGLRSRSTFVLFKGSVLHFSRELDSYFGEGSAALFSSKTLVFKVDYC